MTQEEIIEMAREADLWTERASVEMALGGVKELEAFAKLVDAKATAREREWLIELLNTKYRHTPPQIVEAIRARGEEK